MLISFAESFDTSASSGQLHPGSTLYTTTYLSCTWSRHKSSQSEVCVLLRDRQNAVAQRIQCETVIRPGNNKVSRDTDLQEDTVRQSTAPDTCIYGICNRSIYSILPPYLIGVGKDAWKLGSRHNKRPNPSKPRRHQPERRRAFPLWEGLCARGRTRRHARNLQLQKQLLASRIRTALYA